MIYKGLYEVLCLVYATMLRPLLVKAIDDPDEEWDDILLAAVDRFFNYKG